jgi:hypothetical protein
VNWSSIHTRDKTPGAKSLKVHQFALRMIKDCYGESFQKTLATGLALTESPAQQAYGKAFAACDVTPAQRCAVADDGFERPVGKSFVNMVKRLAIQGYMNSEYYMVNVQSSTWLPAITTAAYPLTS